MSGENGKSFISCIIRITIIVIIIIIIIIIIIVIIIMLIIINIYIVPFHRFQWHFTIYFD